MPEARRTVELRRRQAVFRGLSELEGRSCVLDASIIVLHPSADGASVDLCCIQARTGLRTLRPGATTKFKTERLTERDRQRRPGGLDETAPLGQSAELRLDAFVSATPIEIEVVQDGDRIQYLARVQGNEPADLVLAEVNRAEFPRRPAADRGAPFFTHLAETPCRYGALDVVLHPDLASDVQPELLLYRNTGETQAVPGDPLREVDRIEPLDGIERFDGQPAHRRMLGLPRYGDILTHVATVLGWDLSHASTFRARAEYPIPGTQLTLVLRGASF